MKKNLRLLCLGLAAATFTCSFAQENYTDKLTNADMELASKGWGFEGEKVLGKNTKNPATQTGFYGMNKGVLEAWNANANTPLADSYIMQRLGGLPNGTYVFGAYVGASKQNHRKNVAAEGETAKWEYWNNADSIVGVELFANGAVVPVATLNPDFNYEMPEAHTAKFNVAVTLSDADVKKGYLDAGLRVINTNANYVVWDNATLYFFGDKSEAEALDAMAKIDVDAAIAIADTLKKEHMNKDSLAALTAALDEAGKVAVTAANFNETLAGIYANAAKVRKSITDYKNLQTNIESARVVAEGEWTSVVSADLEALNSLIEEAEAAYEAQTMNREELTALRKKLNWTSGDVKMDSVYLAKEVLDAFIAEAKKLEGQPGGYSAVQLASLNDLQQEMGDTIGLFDEEYGLGLEVEERTINPNGLFSYIDRVNVAIENVKNNTISTEYTTMPIEFKAAADGDMKGWVEGAEWYSQEKRIVAYTSPLYRFQGKVSNFRITVKRAKSGNAFFCLSGLQFFDGSGNPIALTVDNLSTNADHVGNHPEDEGPEGNGIPALFDDDTNTFFHSEWKNNVGADHYLEVNLPNGGYDAFSFRMLSRDNSNGWDQSHTFPGEMIISTPAPKRDALEGLVNQAKAYNAYSFPEVGYYEEDYSYLTDAIAKADAMVKNYAAEAECEAMANELIAAIEQYESNEVRPVRLPVAGKEYRIICGFPGYYEKQGVEKALTAHMADTTLWWGNVSADSLNQVFVFEPILDEDGVPFVKVEFGQNEDGSSWSENYYCYHLKNVGTGLYVDSAFVSNKLKLVKEPTDTLMLYSLGRGQWNIRVKGSTLHCGDHNSGNLGTAQGAYGGIAGLGSGICAYGGGLDGASAWYIREMPAMPVKVAVEGAEYKSEFFHFEAANTITLTADKDCAFTNLALYDRYDAAIAIDSLVVSGNTATIIQENNLVACAFAFTNAEGVAEVELVADWIDPVSAMDYLQEAYDAAVAIDPIVGTAVGEIADISAYTAALEAAEAMLESGVATDKEIDAMVERLDTIAKVLKPNMPEEGKYYFIYNGVTAFETNKGYKMTMFVDEDAELLKWGNENYVNWNRYWQFELANEEELEAAGMEADACAYFIKNVATELYVADGAQSAQVNLTDDREAALPYVVTLLGSGVEVALDGLGQDGKRLHANQHGGGSGNGSNIVYWGSGAGTASAWNIVEVQYDVTDIDFAEVETEKAVVKGTYDLFGRRVVAPTAPGIYIIEGKKRLVK